MKESEMFRANRILEANKRKIEAKEMRKKKIEKKKTIQPNGSMIPQKDWFRPLKNVGVFKKGERG